MARYGASRCAEPDVGASRAPGPDGPVRLVLWTAMAALLSAGCGSLAWQQAGRGTICDVESDVRAREFLCDRAVAGPPGTALGAAPEAICGARREGRAAIEAPVPRFEIFAGIMPRVSIGNKIAGHSGPTAPNNVVYVAHWDEAFEATFGFEVQVNLVRPPRTVVELGAGDTFFGIRVSVESYEGLASPGAPPPGGVPGSWPATVVGTYDDMTVLGFWADGRTLLNPINVGRWARPYLHYGVGVVRYSQVLLTGGGASYPNWDATLALGWHMGVGIELRTSNLGFYIEGGIQAVGPPDVSEDTTGIAPGLVEDFYDQRSAQNLVTYPLRIGVMVAF